MADKDHFIWMWADFPWWHMGAAKRDPLRWSSPEELDHLVRKLPEQDLQRRTVLVRRKRPGAWGFNYIDEQIFSDVKSIYAYFDTTVQGTPLNSSESKNSEERLHLFAAGCSAEIYDRPRPDWSFNNSDSVCGIRLNEDKSAICVAFRGTDSIFDIAADLKCTVKEKTVLKHYGIGVQEGFWSRVDDSSDEIYKRLVNKIKENEVEPANLQLIITGHSYGGACAKLLHALVYQNLQQQQWPFDKDPPGMKGLLEKCMCVVFAAPMVFALPVEEKELDDETKARRDVFSTHMENTSCNYVFYDDPVPRAYGHLQADKLLQVLAAPLDQAARIGGSVLNGLKFFCPRLAAEMGACGEKAKEYFMAGDFLPSKMRDTVNTYNEFASRYKACGKYRLLNGGQKSWIQFALNRKTLQHHSMVGYRTVLQWRLPHAQYHDVIESFNSKTQADVTVPQATLDEKKRNVLDMADELYEQAKVNEWEQLKSLLLEVESGFIERISLDQHECHFIHQAAYHGNVEMLYSLMELGANPARKSERNRTIRDWVLQGGEDGNEGARKEKDLIDWLCDYAEDLEKKGCVASDIASKSSEAMERYIQDGKKTEPDESLVITNLVRLGYTEDQVNECLEVGSKKSYKDLVSLLGEKYPRQQEIEQAHRFLDRAKYGPVDNYQEMLEMLEADTKFATVGRTEELSNRWTALMQVTYNNGSMYVIRKLLAHHPDLNAIKKALTQLQDVQKEIQGVTAPDRVCLKRAAAGYKGAPPGQKLKEIQSLLEAIAAEVERGGEVKDALQKLE